MQAILPYAVIIGLIVTALILATGIVVMNIGGELNKKYGNMLMRLRILSQGITIILFILSALIK
ncbi:MAG: HIG1 domain-containing protein [Alphaproteobacteria bacterium]|nr:HIG1 domain-containing protein [Alphaproteobacteria bacterium]